MFEEVWIDIKGYEGLYQISNYGRVKSLQRVTVDGKHIKEKLLKSGLNKPNYKFVILRKNGVSYNNMIHRLVAEHFISNPNNLREVNHIDGNKHNNHISNLEWVSSSENRQHAMDMQLHKGNNLNKNVEVIDLLTNKHILFKSMMEVSKFFGFKKCWIQNRIRKVGNNFIHKNYKIRVIDYDK